MKIRTDFVTNSSSVSYILTMQRKLAEQMIKFGGDSRKTKKITEFLIDDLLEKGTRCQIADEEIYYKKIEFHTNDIPLYTEIESDENFDLSSLQDDEIWEYFYSKYLLDGNIPNLEGFGATLIEHY